MQTRTDKATVKQKAVQISAKLEGNLKEQIFSPRAGGDQTRA